MEPGTLRVCGKGEGDGTGEPCVLNVVCVEVTYIVRRGQSGPINVTNNPMGE